MEIRWFKYSGEHTPVLQFREYDESRNMWSKWQNVGIVFEKDGYSDT